MHRRTLLKATAFGAIALAGGGLLSSLIGRDPANDQDAVLRALIPALLAGAIADEGAPRTRDIERTLAAVRTATQGLTPSSRAELAQLFGLLAAAPTRIVLARVDDDWPQVDEHAASAFLERWRVHRIALCRAGYQALHDLVTAAWYGDEAHWAAIGYPGPPALS